MAGFTFAVKDFPTMFRLAIMTTKAILEGSGAKGGAFGIIRIPGLRIS
jgi:hypothetical protein